MPEDKELIDEELQQVGGGGGDGANCPRSAGGKCTMLGCDRKYEECRTCPYNN